MELLPTPTRPAPEERALSAAVARALTDSNAPTDAVAAFVDNADAADRGGRVLGVALAAATAGLRVDLGPDRRSEALAETVDGVLELADDDGAAAATADAMATDPERVEDSLAASTAALQAGVPAVLAGDVDGDLRSTLTEHLGGDHEADGLAAVVALLGALRSRPVIGTLSATLGVEVDADVEAAVERARTSLEDRLRALDDTDAGRQPPEEVTDGLQPIRSVGKGASLPPDQAWIRSLRAALAVVGGDHPTAHEHYATAVESFQNAGEDTPAAVCRVNFAGLYHRIGEFDAALEQYDLANERFRAPTVQLRRAGAICTLSLGEAAVDADEIARAEGYLDRAREDFEEANDPWGVARSREALASAALRRGSPTDAAADYREALALYDRLDDHRGRASASLGLARCARSDDVDDQPDGRLTDAITAAGRVGDDETVGAAAVSFGELASERGDHDVAREHFQRALEAFRQAGDRSGEATSLHNLGRLAQEAGDAEAARERLTAARDAFREAGDRYGAARSIDRLGQLAREEHPERARERFETAADTFLELGVVRDAFPTLSSLVEVAIETGETDLARQRCETALDLLDRVNDEERREHFERLRDRIPESEDA